MSWPSVTDEDGVSGRLRRFLNCVLSVVFQEPCVSLLQRFNANRVVFTVATKTDAHAACIKYAQCVHRNSCIHKCCRQTIYSLRMYIAICNSVLDVWIFCNKTLTMGIIICRCRVFGMCQQSVSNHLNNFNCLTLCQHSFLSIPALVLLERVSGMQEGIHNKSVEWVIWRVLGAEYYI